MGQVPVLTRTKDGSIHKINGKLLHKHPVVRALTGPNGQAFSANEHAELFANTFVEQFSSNHGPAIPEVAEIIQKINDAAPSPSEFITPSTVEYLMKQLVKTN